MIFDTDMIIWVQRGNGKVAKFINETSSRFISVVSYIELLQGAQNKEQHKYIKNFIYEFHFKMLPLSENIGHRASIYIEEYGIKSGLRLGDALVAATAIESDLALATSNAKHFKSISELQLKVVKP